MGTKRGAAETEGDDGGGGEEEEEDEEEDRDEDDELSQHEQQQRERELHDEDVDDDQRQHEPGNTPAKNPKLTKPQKGPLKRVTFHSDDDEENRRASGEPVNRAGHTGSGARAKEDDEEEENLEIELGKCQTVDPEKMQSILAQFTPEQMSRYECYRRSGFQKANMRRLLQSVAGCPISMPMTIVMSGIAKMFVGELVEAGRMVMTERNESGPIRPCHIRESYRRLKLKGKVPLRT